MSAYSEIGTSFTDPELLLSALTAMGYKGIKNHIGNPQSLEGYMGDRRSTKAELIIPRREVGGMSNDVGFARGANGTFQLIVSDYDQHKYSAESAWYKKVKFNYAEQNILRAAKKQGLRPIHTGKKLDNGKLEYKFLKA